MNHTEANSDSGNHQVDHPRDQRVSTEVKEGTGRTLAIAAGVVLLVLLIGFGAGLFYRLHKDAQARKVSADASDAMPAVDVVTVRPTAAGYPLMLPGKTAGWLESTIYARVDGYVGQWFSDIGDPVKTGQVLATIETPELDQQLDAAMARVNASTAMVQVADANQSIAKTTYDRWWQSPKGVVSEQERQEKKSTFESAVAQVESAKAQHQLDMAGVDRLKALEAFKNVTAPYDGIITGRQIDFGDLITAGSSGSTSPLYNIAQTDTIRVFVDVPQKAATDMVIGLDATVVSDQFPGRIFHGKVSRSTRSIDPQSLTQKTEVDIVNKDLVLSTGMAVDVTFQLNQKGLLQVPAASILFKPGGLQVAVVNDQNKVDFRTIRIARDNGETVELASGVNPDERVALNISNYIVAGEEVKPVDVDSQMVPMEMQPPIIPAPAVQTIGPSPNGAPPSDYTPVPKSGKSNPALVLPHGKPRGSDEQHAK